MDIFKLPVFPAADVFPMMNKEELAELAADIKANGLREPVVTAKVNKKDILIDGRNRRDACKIAGVKPTSRELNGEDLTAFVVSANIHRRNMTVGQRAMAVAKIYPESPTGRGNKNPSNLGFSSERLRQARTVINHSPDSVALVLAGAVTLDAAFDAARANKQAASSDEAKLARLRERSPELADKVVEGDLTLAGAVAEADARDDVEKTRRANVWELLSKLQFAGSFLTNATVANETAATLNCHEEEARKAFVTKKVLLETCANLRKSLPALEAKLKGKGNV